MINKSNGPELNSTPLIFLFDFCKISMNKFLSTGNPGHIPVNAILYDLFDSNDNIFIHLS